MKLNGRSLTEWNLDAFRRLTGYVPQDVFLFSDSIAGNIAFGLADEEADLASVQGAAVEAHVAHNIEGFENGYETVWVNAVLTSAAGRSSASPLPAHF